MKRLSNGHFALWICAAFVIPAAMVVVIHLIVESRLSPYWTTTISMAPIVITTPLLIWLLVRYLSARDRDSTTKPVSKNGSQE